MLKELATLVEQLGVATKARVEAAEARAEVKVAAEVKAIEDSLDAKIEAAVEKLLGSGIDLSGVKDAITGLGAPDAAAPADTVEGAGADHIEVEHA